MSLVSQCKVREKGGDKLRFYPKVSELYFPVIYKPSTRNHQKSKILQQKIEYYIILYYTEPLLDPLEYQKQNTTTQ